ncbi:MAG TPA: quinolinate synthase NadA, partial [Verrucomicrobiae bacterium]|nr:quinolinate synthase NadA [Verrucomicrobiae bacterium]
MTLVAGAPLVGPRPFADFVALDAETIRSRTWAAKRALGRRTVILGHHYQREGIIEFADFRGDSFKLSQLAAAQAEARFIVFCGVHFMAESADVLAQPHQTVILPDVRAGCSMADMASLDDVEDAWDQLVAEHGDTFTPITYMNSSAALKAFCGARGGVVCTSSNARAALEWAWARKPRVLFFPDQHLGRNTAHAMGVPLEHMAEWIWRAPSPRQVN